MWIQKATLCFILCRRESHFETAVFSSLSHVGIVPVSAMFQEHVRNVLRLSPDVHFRIVEEARKHRAEYEFAEEERKGSVAKKIASQCCGPSHQRRGGLDDQAFGQTRKDSRRHTIMSTLTEVSNEALQSVSDSSFNAAIPSRSTNDLKRAAFQATKSIYGVVFMGFLTVYAATVLSLSLVSSSDRRELDTGIFDPL